MEAVYPCAKMDQKTAFNCSNFIGFDPKHAIHAGTALA
jgi:hypothetical protein